MELEKLLNYVGKSTFIKYLELFENNNIENKDIISEIEEDYTLNSKNSRTSKARRILREYGLKEILINILHSKKLDEDIKSKARKRLNKFSSQSD
jgi:phenylalanyl-tRNA synthetase beta subunit